MLFQKALSASLQHQAVRRMGAGATKGSKDFWKRGSYFGVPLAVGGSGRFENRNIFASFFILNRFGKDILPSS